MLNIEVVATTTYTYELTPDEEQKVKEMIKNNPKAFQYMEDDEIIANAVGRLWLNGDIWFTYNAIDHNVEMFVAECHAVQSTTEIANIISLMEYQHPEYEKYKTAYDNFNALVKERLKKQIRKLMTEVKGEFSKDNFIKDTYFQVRQFDDKEIFYVIHNWWKGLCDGEINFVDVVNGEGTVFIARCK